MPVIAALMWMLPTPVTGPSFSSMNKMTSGNCACGAFLLLNLTQRQRA
jgi:hypothetical protein